MLVYQSDDLKKLKANHNLDGSKILNILKKLIFSYSSIFQDQRSV